MEHKKELKKIKNLHLYANIQKYRVSSKLGANVQEYWRIISNFVSDVVHVMKLFCPILTCDFTICLASFPGSPPAR